MRYRPEIDGLRAIAVVPVIGFHAGVAPFSGGFVGVDVFFVISGYLITALLIEDLAQGHFSLMRFYERRARRILPALCLVCLACLPAAWLWMSPFQIEAFAQSLMAVSLFASNLLFWQQSDYFAAAADENPLLHSWSLAVEEQYYLLFPLLLMLGWRMGRGRLMWMLAGLAICSLGWAEWMLRRDAAAAFYLAPARAWELFAGGLAAFVLARRSLRPQGLLAGLGLGAILAAVVLFDAGTRFPGLAALVPVSGTVLVVLWARDGTAVARWLAHPALVGIGLVSYSAYLWHQPLFAFARIAAGDVRAPLWVAALILASFGLAWLSWRYVERPFRDRSRVDPQRLWLAVAVMLLVPLGVGAAGVCSRGFFDLVASPGQQAYLDTARPSPMRLSCHTSGPAPLGYDDACTYHEGPVRVAVFGDSHGVELAWALAGRLRPAGIGLRHLTYSGCVPTLGTPLPDFADCAGWSNAILQRLETDPAITHVVLTYRIGFALYGRHEPYYPALPDNRGASVRARIWADLLAMMARLQAAGKQVIWVNQAPELPAPMASLVMRQNRGAQGPVAGVSRDWWQARLAHVYTHLGDHLGDAAAQVGGRTSDLPDDWAGDWTGDWAGTPPAGVRVVDPAALFCDADICLAGTAGVAFYFDDDHMSVAGAERVATAIIAAAPELSEPELAEPELSAP